MAGNLYIADSYNSRVRKVSNSGVITTVAGNGSYGYSGDGGPATQAGLDDPNAVTVDSGGNLFIADTSNFVIRKVSPADIISTVAGNGTPGYSGDGGPATGATFSAIFGVTVDASGNIYIADTDNYRIRKVSVEGTVSTYAGDGQCCYSGDGGPATSAQIYSVFSIAVDASGTLYIADGYNGRVRKVSTAGIITTVAGNGTFGDTGDGGLATSAEMGLPEAVAAAPNGTLYIEDGAFLNIREVSPAQIISTVAGNGEENYFGDNGPATSGLLGGPQSAAVASDGAVYVADTGNYRIRKVSGSGVITSVAGNGISGYTGDNGPATAAELTYPLGLAVDASGNIYVADESSVVRRIDVAGVITTFAGNGKGGYTGDGGPATEASLSLPWGIAVDNSGNVYIANTAANVVRKVGPDGIITTVAGDGSLGYSGDNGPAVSAMLDYPQGVAVDVNGNLYITDGENHVVRKVNSSGIITTVAGNGSFGYSGDGGPATSAQLAYPDGVAVDALGNLYIADSSNSDIRKVSSTGIITTIAGFGYGYYGDGGPAISASFSGPGQIALGPEGSLYVADSYNNAIRSLTVCIQALASTADADSSAQTLSTPLTAAGNCSWSASNLPPWITSASSGTGSGTLSLTLPANSTGADLTSTINVNGLPLTITQRFTTQAFVDVPANEYYFDAVNLLKGTMITTGCTATDYCPSEDVTRAEMAIFIVRAVIGTGTFTYSPTPHFTDVQPTDYGFSYIQKLFELGITTGCALSLYCPSASISRAQMAVFIIRARYGAQTVVDYPPTPYFTDVPASGYAYNFIQRMREDNLTSGCSLTTYCPSDPVTRGDMAIFIMRGAFNQLLPSTEPVIVSVSPATIPNGTSATLTVMGGQTNFVGGSTIVNAVPGLVVNSVTVLDATTLQVIVTANTVTTPQPLSIWVTDSTDEAVLPNGLLVQ